MRCKSGAMVDLIDASSLLYRLQMEGICIETAGIAVGGGGREEVLVVLQPYHFFENYKDLLRKKCF